MDGLYRKRESEAPRVCCSFIALFYARMQSRCRLYAMLLLPCCSSGALQRPFVAPRLLPWCICVAVLLRFIEGCGYPLLLLRCLCRATKPVYNLTLIAS